MSAHVHDTGGTLLVALVSAGIGLLNYMTQTEVMQAVLVAGACGLAGGLMKGLGTHAWKVLHERWSKRKVG